MIRFRNALLALLMGCFVPVVIWVVGGVALYQVGMDLNRKRKMRELTRAQVSGLSCSLDSDCPCGYVCINGYCVPDRAV